MLKKLKCGLVLFLYLMFTTLLSFGQNGCNLDSIVFELQKANYVKNTKLITGLSSVPFSERIDSQYLRYEALKNCASIKDLRALLNSQNNVVVIYSWKALLSQKPTKALDFLLKNATLLDEKEVFEFLNYCQGTVTKKLSVFMTYELYDKLLSKEIDLTSTEIVDFLNFKEELSKANLSIQRKELERLGF